MFHDQNNTNSWLKYDPLNPSTYRVTTLRPAAVNCTPSGTKTSTTNITGDYSVDLTGVNNFKINRDILGDFYNTTCTSPDGVINNSNYNMLGVINGYDSYLMESITTFRNTSNVLYVGDRKVPGIGTLGSAAAGTNATDANVKFPSPFQMIAADVNMSNTVRANDITLVQQRAVGKICEYPQNWNYILGTDPNKYPANNTENRSLDWRFTDKTSGGDFDKSNGYPNASTGGVHYWRDDVPDVPACLVAPTPVAGCKAFPTNKNIYGILLGDLDGSWRGDATGQQTHKESATTSRTVILDYTNIQKTGVSTYRVPVKFSSGDTTVSVDFSLDYDETKLKVLGVGKLAAAADADARMMHNDHNGQELLFTSYSMVGFGLKNTLYYIDFASEDGIMNPGYLGHGEGYLNGQRVALVLEGVTATGTLDQLGVGGYGFEVVPNPINGTGNILYNLRNDDNARIVVYNAVGQIVLEYNSVKGTGSFEISATDLAAGMYQVILYKGDTDRLAKKLVIQK